MTVASLLLLSGALDDRFGRRRVLATGLVVMLAASVLCAIAPGEIGAGRGWNEALTPVGGVL